MSDLDKPRSRPLGELKPEELRVRDKSEPHSRPIAETRPAEPGDIAADLRERPPRSWALRLLLAGAGLLIGGLLALAGEALLARALEADSRLAWIALGGLMLLALGFLLAFLKEWVGLASLDRLRETRRQAEWAEAEGRTEEVEAVLRDLRKLYRGRSDMEWSLRRLEEQREAALAVGGLLPLAEREILLPLDARAQAVSVSAVRRAAMITAISPFALLDMLVSLIIGLGLLRRIARIYGGRPGWLGAWRLLRLSLAQVLASGALDLADDTLGDVIGAGIASRVSRRAGIGLLNGLLTARIASAAMDLCRPFPWSGARRPSARGLLRRALTDLRAAPPEPTRGEGSAGVS